MGLVDKILGVDNQPKGYYEMHKTYYQPPPEVGSVKPASQHISYHLV